MRECINQIHYPRDNVLLSQRLKIIKKKKIKKNEEIDYTDSKRVSKFDRLSSYYNRCVKRRAKNNIVGFAK